VYSRLGERAPGRLRTVEMERSPRYFKFKRDCRALGAGGHVLLTRDRFGIEKSGGCAYFTASRPKINAEAPSPVSFEALVPYAREPDRTPARKGEVETESQLRCSSVGGFLSLVTRQRISPGTQDRFAFR
jgi:hypothetical protein